jgi:hypothetical protein
MVKDIRSLDFSPLQDYCDIFLKIFRNTTENPAGYLAARPTLERVSQQQIPEAPALRRTVRQGQQRNEIIFQDLLLILPIHNSRINTYIRIV